jgi:peptidoglycan/LPS O-acetylase OafA/YrhL
VCDTEIDVLNLGATQSANRLKPNGERMGSLSLHDHLTRGHDNNLPLIRMVAALMVLVSHTFALSSGLASDEPWRTTYGHTPGTIAVEVFFVISGVLLTHSLTTRQSLPAFAVARILRIYPGLMVAVLLTVMLVSSLASSLNVQTWITSPSLWHHIFVNASALMPTAYELPGVFLNNPAQGVVNGSLWSLRWELGAYIVLAALWGMAHGLRRPLLFKISALVLLALLAGLLIVGPIIGRAQAPYQVIITRVAFMFTAGSALCVLSPFIKLTHVGALAAAALLMVGVLNPKLFTLVYTVTLPYLLVYLAFVPRGAIRQYNRLGDYSYGTYLYAFPLQQLLVALNPGITNAPLMIGSWVLTMLAAIASWHWVEKPAMAWQKRLLRGSSQTSSATQTLPPVAANR